MPPKKGFRKNVENTNNNNNINNIKNVEEDEGSNSSRNTCNEAMELLIKLFQQAKGVYRQEKMSDYENKLKSLSNDENEILREKMNEMKQRYLEERDHISKRFDIKIVCVTEEAEAEIRTLKKEMELLRGEKKAGKVGQCKYVSTPFTEGKINKLQMTKAPHFDVKRIETVYRKPAPYTSRAQEILERASSGFLTAKKEQKNKNEAFC